MLIETIGEGCRGQKVGSVERMTADPGQVVAWRSDLDDSDERRSVHSEPDGLLGGSVKTDDRAAVDVLAVQIEST